MTDPTLCQPLRLAEPITGGPFRRGGRFSPATWRKFSVQLASLIRYMHVGKYQNCRAEVHFGQGTVLPQGAMALFAQISQRRQAGAEQQPS